MIPTGAHKKFLIVNYCMTDYKGVIHTEKIIIIIIIIIIKITIKKMNGHKYKTLLQIITIRFPLASIIF